MPVRCLFVLAVALSGAHAYVNGVARFPAMGWNTWCTEGSCGNTGTKNWHDVCNAFEMLEVAHAMLENGMYKLGWDRVHADDCWGATSRDAAGRIQADPQRFPLGWKAFASELRDLGFKNGLYTSMGNETCSSGGRPAPIPGSYGHYTSDAQTFASWGVDYVKVDFCDDHVPTAQPQHEAFSNALNATGHPMWLELCRGYSYPPPPYVVQYAQSARVAGDHHDTWDNTADAIQSLASAAATHRGGRSKGYWGYGDFLMTGGAGCDVNSTAHCPGMTTAEYHTEFAVWAIAASPLIVATDVRNMTAVMKDILLNEEAIAVNQDAAAEPGAVVGSGNCDAAQASTDCQYWARSLSDGTVAALLYNADDSSHTLTLDFALLGLPGKTLQVRDIWGRKDAGTATGSLTATLAGHASYFVRLTDAQRPPAPLQPPYKEYTPAAKAYLASVGKRE